MTWPPPTELSSQWGLEEVGYSIFPPSPLPPPSFHFHLWELPCIWTNNNSGAIVSMPCLCRGSGWRESREESDKWKVGKGDVECSVQSTCINDEITLADGSDLRSVPQICGWLAHTRVHIHAFPLSCEVCPWLSFFFELFSYPSPRSCSTLLLARSLHLYFIHRNTYIGWGIQAFRPRPTASLPPPLLFSVSTSGFLFSL